MADPSDPMPDGCGVPLGSSGYLHVYCGRAASFCRRCRPAVMAWRDRQLNGGDAGASSVPTAPAGQASP